MSDQWFRFGALLITQGVILAGLILNRRDARGAGGVAEPVARIEQKVDKVQDTMTAHLLDHSHTRRR